MSDHNVGLGMVPHRKGCRCEECTIDRLEAKVRTMQARIDALAAALRVIGNAAHEKTLRSDQVIEIVGAALEAEK